MSYSPELGRWMEADPAGYVDGLDVYQYELSNPLNRTDPQGTNAAQTKPAAQPPPPGDREHYIDPKVPGAGIVGSAEPNMAANCIGAACAIPKNLGWPGDPKFVPRGCEIVDGSKLGDDPPCDANSIIMIVSFGMRADDKNPSIHVIFRDGSAGSGYQSKLGAAPSMADTLQESGSWVRGITDIDAHFKWYHGGTDRKETARLYFRCNRRKVEVGENGVPK